MNDTWNEICFELNDCISKNVQEKEYENAIVNCMALLGWKKYKGEIKTQYAIQTGHEKKYADIVILKDGIEQFVIEIKRPTHILQEDDEKQLFSYMRLLNHRVTFGLYIGDRIRLYYDDTESQKFPESVFSVEIIKDNPDGVSFACLFSKDNFDTQTLADFCRKQKEQIIEKRQVREEVHKLLSDKTCELFRELLRKKYMEEGRSQKWADSVLAQVRLDISPVVATNAVKSDPEQIPAGFARTAKQQHDKTRYGILGSEPLAKRKFVLETVKNFVRKNPPMTYKEYDSILNKLRPDSQGVIRPMESLSEKRMIRYFTDKDSRMTSSDGITFVVCNQWGDFNIGPVIKFAEEQGFNVAEYKQQ